jgi:hypothetical protein
MKTWVYWSEISGSAKVTEAEFKLAINQFPRSAWLIACARLSILFKFGPDANTVASKQDTAQWAPLMFPPVLLPRVMKESVKDRPVFFQGQLRYLAAQVMRLDPAYPEDGKIIPDIVLGGILLAAGELLYKPMAHNLPDDLDKLANLIADFLPTYEIDSLTDPLIYLLRAYIFLEIIIPTLPQSIRDKTNVEELWENTFHFPLKQYWQFVYACTVHAINERESLAKGNPPTDGGIAISWFKTTILKPWELSTMFDAVSCNLSDLPDKKKAHGFADFEYLKDHPYFRVDDKMYAIDYEFAVSKLESGALWRVAMEMPKKKREPYFGFWGEVFDRYVHWVFQNYAVKTKNIYYPSPMYLNDKDNRPICDAIVMCGSTAVVIESKLGTCAAETRYSGEHKKFREYLERSLVTGSDRPVGVAQLLTTIKNIASGPKEALPEWLHNVRKIIPVIITKDEIGSSWVTNAYLNRRFQDQLSRKAYKPIKITPLVSMSISTLERTISGLSQMAFSDILEDRINEDPDLTRPFEAASSWVQRGTPGNLSKHVEIMEDLSAKMTADFGMVDDMVISA